MGRVWVCVCMRHMVNPIGDIEGPYQHVPLQNGFIVVKSYIVTHAAAAFCAVCGGWCCDRSAPRNWYQPSTERDRRCVLPYPSPPPHTHTHSHNPHPSPHTPLPTHSRPQPTPSHPAHHTHPINTSDVRAPPVPSQWTIARRHADRTPWVFERRPHRGRSTRTKVVCAGRAGVCVCVCEVMV